MLNSTATIFTMDIYKQIINPTASENKTVKIGRISAAIALILGSIMAPLLGGIDQAFQFIQEYTGIVSPGILAVFMLGLFWKKTTNKGAIIGALISIPTAMFLKIGSKGWVEGAVIESLFPSLPFLDQMGLTTLFTMLVIILVSLNQNKGADDPKGIELKEGVFKTDQIFNIGSFAILLILAVIYSLFW